MRHEDDSFRTIINGVFNRGESADDALVVGDFLVGVEGDVEVNLLSELVCGANHWQETRIET